MERTGICSTCLWTKGCVLNNGSAGVIQCEEFSAGESKAKKISAVHRKVRQEETEAE